MDGERFDRLARTLAAGATRRRVLRGAGGGLAAALGAALGRGAAAAPNPCAVGCANLKGPQKAACGQACRQCDGDFDRVCVEFGPFGPTGFTCCPEGTFCVGEGGVCCEIGTQPCFGPGGEITCCPEGTFCNFETGACEALVLCEPGVPADNCLAGVFSDCGPGGACGLVDNADGEGCDCIERVCTEIPCTTDADCAEVGGLCVSVPGCCFEPTFCAIACGGGAGAAPADARRWG